MGQMGQVALTADQSLTTANNAFKVVGNSNADIPKQTGEAAGVLRSQLLQVLRMCAR
jgi:hypothetical protein